MKTTKIEPTRLREYIKELLSFAHGHQRKAIADFVDALFDKQTGCQAELARTQGNQEAACRRLSRLIHNPRLAPKALAEAVCRQALRQVRIPGKFGSRSIGPLKMTRIC